MGLDCYIECFLCRDNVIWLWMGDDGCDYVGWGWYFFYGYVIVGFSWILMVIGESLINVEVDKVVWIFVGIC